MTHPDITPRADVEWNGTPEPERGPQTPSGVSSANKPPESTVRKDAVASQRLYAELVAEFSEPVAATLADYVQALVDEAIQSHLDDGIHIHWDGTPA